MLKAGKVFHIKAESGGLLKLVLQLAPMNLSKDLIFKTEWFWFVFHFATGGIMVIAYFVFLDKRMIRLWVKGALLSLFPWLVNEIIVLPLIGQGVLGSSILPVNGIVYFLMANILFGYSLVYILHELRNMEIKSPPLPDRCY